MLRTSGDVRAPALPSVRPVTLDTQIGPLARRRIRSTVGNWLMEHDFQMFRSRNLLGRADESHEPPERSSSKGACTSVAKLLCIPVVRSSAERDALRAVAVLSKQVSTGLDSLGPPSLMQLLHACARWKPLRSPDLTEGILQNVSQRISEFQAQSLCLLVHSCSRLQQRDVRLLTQVAKAMAPQLSQFTPQALALAAHAFARLDVRSEILFYLMAEEIVQKMPLFSGQGVGLTLQAFGKLQIKNQKLVRACIKHVRALSEELTVQEVDAIEAGLQQLEMLDGSTDALLRSLRRKLMMQAAYSPEDDPWEASAESLLQRLSEDAEMTVVRADSREYSPTLPKQTSEDSVEESPERIQSDGGPADLWALWSSHPHSEAVEGASPADVGSETAGATPRAKLKEYLSRPAQIGRKTMVVGELQRGRKSGRRQDKASD
eukprot:s633_g20.t1